MVFWGIPGSICWQYTHVLCGLLLDVAFELSPQRVLMSEHFQIENGIIYS